MTKEAQEELQKLEDSLAPFGVPSRYNFQKAIEKIYDIGFDNGIEFQRELERKFDEGCVIPIT